MKSVAFLVAATTLSFCAELHAQQALRCDGDLAMPRDSKAVVVWKCGEPFFVQSFCKIIDPSEGVMTLLPIGPYAPGMLVAPWCQLVEEWYYNPGPGQFIAIMRFEQGVMRSIRYGDRVR